MRHEPATSNGKCAEIASKQHGVITWRALLDAGLSPNGISRRVRAGRLHRIHRGVYAVGHSGLSDEGRWMAVVLACGQGAVLSHRSAAEHLELLKPLRGSIHVTLADGGGRSKRDGLVVHRSASLTKAQTTSKDGIALTTPARTIADLRRTEHPAVVAKALRAASFKGLEVGNEGEDVGTRSELERRFLRFCHRNGLSLPAVNVAIPPYTVDFLWRGARPPSTLPTR